MGVPVRYEACACPCHCGVAGGCAWLYDRDRVPTPSASELRLLPWATPSGNPCYLSSTGSGTVALYADELEDVQLDEGNRVLMRVVEILSVDTPDETLRLLGAIREMAAALSNVLRVADSRGARLPGPPPL